MMFFDMDKAKMAFAKPKILPQIMVAPNGARRTIADHPAIPVTIKEIVTTAASCYEAGAGAMHFHVRDNEQQHVLDAFIKKPLLSWLLPSQKCIFKLQLRVWDATVLKICAPSLMRLCHQEFQLG